MDLIIAAALTGFIVGVLVGGSRRRPTSKPPIKPVPSGGRMRDAYGLPTGYIPRPQGDTPNPPPSDP